MIFYCEDCKQYWTDGLNIGSDFETVRWSYCTKEGIRIGLCPMCVKEAGEIIKNPMPDSTEERGKLRKAPRQTDKSYLAELRSQADCKKCDNKQADNVDMIEHGHPCFLCIGKAYNMDTSFLHTKNNFKSKYSEACPICTEKYGAGDMNCANPVEHKPDEYCRLEHVHDTPKKHIWSYGEPGKRCDNCGYTIKSEAEVIDNQSA